jgi:hypothetical protein
MSSSELEQLESLIYQALPDPRGFADRVLGELASRLTTGSPVVQPVPLVQGAVEDLDDIRILLTAALGACECWGQDPDCDLCDGAGSSGWTAPDEDLYTEYVVPAVRRRADTAGAANTTSRADPAASDEGARR